MNTITAYNAGKLAFYNGKEFTANPHKKTCADHERWALGWKHAREEARNKTDNRP